ncbi:MAG: cytochrome P450 [Xanthobacteraceae bacterium]
MASLAKVDYESLPFLNVFSPEYAKDPLGTIQALGEGQPMARSPRGLECLSYDLSWELLRDERFPVGFEELLTMCGLPTDGMAYHYFAHNTAALEGEEHRRQRRLLAPLFSPAAIERARQVARQIVAELLDSQKSNEFDFAVDVAPHVPSAFFCYLIGAPMSDRALVAAYSDSMIKAFRADPAFRDEIEHGTNTLVDYVRQHIERKRANLGEDALSQLIEAEQRGETTTDEIVEILFTMLAASTDNTNASLSHAVMAFAENPEQWNFLRKNAALVPDAVQECARMRPNNWSDPRIAREDAEFAGVPLPKGTWLFASIIAGNYDPTVFEAPYEFRIQRERSRPILNFGSGRHLCLGRPVALVELEETLRLLVERFSRIEVIGEVARDGQPHGDFIRRLPIRVSA